MSTRAEELARRVERGAAELIAAVEGLSAADVAIQRRAACGIDGQEQPACWGALRIENLPLNVRQPAYSAWGF